ncbi:MAG: hypothetical protein IPK03_13850 [Bacteroidetes bacterium]|nr:hypothetical protein [Bacteroidota bacterium]
MLAQIKRMQDKVEEHSDDAYAAGGSFILNADNLETGLMDVTEVLI